jgi:hypothetical protein
VAAVRREQIGRNTKMSVSVAQRLLFITCLITLCIFTQHSIAFSETPIDREKKKVAIAYYRCLESAVARLDKGRSDARTVAMTVRSRCAAEYRRAMVVFTRALPSYVRPVLFESLTDFDLEFATIVVFEERKRRTSPNRGTSAR